MESTNSWPPLNASQSTIRAFYDAAFDKQRVQGLFGEVRSAVDFDIIFDKPTAHPKFRNWIQFLFQRVLVREWDNYTRTSKGGQDNGDNPYLYLELSAFLRETLVEWRKSPKWEPLTPSDCPVSYLFGLEDWKEDFEYEKVVIPKTPAETKPKFDPEKDTIPSSLNATDEETLASTINEEKILGATMKSESVKKERLETTHVKKAGIELVCMRKEYNGNKMTKKEAIKEESDLEVVDSNKAAKPLNGKRKFVDAEEFQRKINHPSITKRPRYRVVQVYEILDSDEE